MKFTFVFLALILMTGCSPKKNLVKPDINKLLKDDSDELVIQLYGYLGELSKWGEDIENLNIYQKRFYLNQQFEAEVNNGGLSQFFFNSSGNYTKETLQSLQEIGAYKAAVFLEEAIKLFPDATVPVDRTQRQEYLESVDKEKLNKLDEQFSVTEDNLQALNIKYIEEHKEKF